MGAKATDPGRHIALMALENRPHDDMLEDVLRYAFDQLCWLRTTPQLDAVLDGLRAVMSEES